MGCLTLAASDQVLGEMRSKAGLVLAGLSEEEMGGKGLGCGTSSP